VSIRHAPFLLKALLVVAGALALGAWPALALGGDEGLLALVLAGGAAWVGAVFGRLPRRFLPQATPEGQASAIMAGIGARLLATATLALLVVLLDLAPRLPFASSLVALYLVLLAMEALDAVALLDPGGVRGRGAPRAGPGQEEGATAP
jgi:hypothetical protein